MQRLVRRVPQAFVIVALAATVFAATGFALAATAQPASACSCATLGDDAAFADADAVFSGVLAEVRTPAGERFNSSDPERFIFDVDRVYKGEVFERQSVVTAREGASCGLELSIQAGRILVFGRRDGDFIVQADDGELAANLCNGTRPVLASNPVPFGAGALPRAGSSPIGVGPARSAPAVRAPTDWSSTTWLVVLVGGTLVVSLGARLLVRRRA